MPERQNGNQQTLRFPLGLAEKRVYKKFYTIGEANGLTDDLKNKIDVFFAVGRITEEQYNELMDVNKEEEPKAENN